MKISILTLFLTSCAMLETKGDFKNDPEVVFTKILIRLLEKAATYQSEYKCNEKSLKRAIFPVQKPLQAVQDVLIQKSLASDEEPSLVNKQRPSYILKSKRTDDLHKMGILRLNNAVTLYRHIKPRKAKKSFITAKNYG